MHRLRIHSAFTSLALGLLAAGPALGASLQQVTKNEWASGVPSYTQMHIYVPDKLAPKPPIVVSAHSCGSSASGQMGQIPRIRAAADELGFILVLPDNPGQNCWDVGSNKSLTHDGGGDTQAVAQMVKYALTKYNGDATRVYVFGGSSGAMLTQAMLAVYPELFRAGSARAGVPAGCWAVEYDSCGTPQWSCQCANGNVTHSAEEWGDLVRAMHPSYTGPRPRVQLMQGGADTTISSKNMPESVKQWSNVLGLSAEPTSKDTGFNGQVGTYDRQIWKNDCDLSVLESWVAPGKGHSMGYEEDAILQFFGLDKAGAPDPTDACNGGTGGTGGAGGAGGTGAGGMSGVGAAGQAASGASNTSGGVAGSPGAGGNTSVEQAGSGGSGTSAPLAGAGGLTGNPGASGTGGSIPASSGGSQSPVEQGNAGTPAQPTPGTAGSGVPPTVSQGTESGGCHLAVGTQRSRSAFGATAFLLGLVALGRRRRRARARRDSSN